jgi:putative ABC transport system permease protein
VGLGLLIGVTLTMAGVYRGMVDDARAARQQRRRPVGGAAGHAGALRRVVQHRDDVVRSVLGMPGVARAANVTYLTMQVRSERAKSGDVRAMVVGFEARAARRAGYLVAGATSRAATTRRWPTCAPALRLGERIRIRRHDYTVVGLTRRMVSSGGDPMVFIPLKDAQEAQFLKDNDAIVNDRARTAANPAFNRPGVPRPAGGGASRAGQQPQRQRRAGAGEPGLHAEAGGRADPALEAPEVYTRAQMEEILVAKLIATSAKQIGMFLVILAIVSAAIVAFIIYTMTWARSARSRCSS